MKAFFVLSVALFAMSVDAADSPKPEAQNGSRRGILRQQAPPAAEVVPKAAPRPLPNLPEGVSDLKFVEIFKSPVGERGLEFSDKTKTLDGKKVRLLGYMVRQSTYTPWKILLSAMPVTVCEKEYGFCDDLPASIVHVTLPKGASPIPQFTPGLMLLTGTLHLGNREEADGRLSTVRLDLLQPPTAPAASIPRAVTEATAP